MISDAQPVQERQPRKRRSRLPIRSILQGTFAFSFPSRDQHGNADLNLPVDVPVGRSRTGLRQRLLGIYQGRRRQDPDDTGSKADCHDQG
jgi:hypothetical protein